MTHHTLAENGEFKREVSEFKGTVKQSLEDIRSRMGSLEASQVRIEDKLDRQIEKNVFVSAMTSLVVAVITIFSGTPLIKK